MPQRHATRRARRLPHQAAGATGEHGIPQRIVVHLCLDDETALVTYSRATERRGQKRPREVLVRHGGLAALLTCLGRGRASVERWLNGELESPSHSLQPTPAENVQREAAGHTLTQLTGAQEGRPEQVVAERPRPMDPRIAKIVEALETAYDKEASVEDAAALAHLSRSQFSRVFRKETGSSFKNFLTSIRVRVAAALLVRAPFESVTAISLRTGPWELGTFERAFRKHFGCTPSKYRKLALAARDRRHTPSPGGAQGPPEAPLADQDP